MRHHLLDKLPAFSLIEARSAAAERDTRRAVGLINANFQESLAGAKVIHVFRQESRIVAILQHSLARFLAATTKASLYNSFLPPVMELLAVAGQELIAPFDINAKSNKTS